MTEKNPLADRYDGKPFLRLVDSYVLRAIGHLGPEQETNLQAWEPKFAEIFKCTGTWVEIVEQRMELPKDTSARIKALWDQTQANAAANGAKADPRQFTVLFVDRNFPH